MTINELRECLCNYARQGYQDGLFAATSGNLSMIDREKQIVAITPTSLAYETMQPDDIVLLSLSGKILEGGKPSSEAPMHLALYDVLPEIGAVVHTHSPNATAFAVVAKPIPVILIEMMYFLLGEVPVAPYAMPGTIELGIGAANALKNRGACLLQNHGVVSVGTTIKQSYTRAIYTEDAAKICRMATTLGEPTIISLEEQNKMREKMGVPLE